MKRFWRISLFVVAIVAVILAVAISATIGWRPFIGPRARALNNRKFEVTPERLARGSYLANSVSGCVFCHSPHDWNAPGAPLIDGKLGAGEVFPLEGLPGRIVAPNITPDAETGAGTWSDDQLARAIREGIGHDGRALFPLMPYGNFRVMSDEDLASVVGYLRSLAAVRNSLPSTEIIFPVKYLIRSAPEPVEGAVSALPPDTSAAYGTYLVRITHRSKEDSRCQEWLSLADWSSKVRSEPLPARTSRRILPALGTTMRKFSLRLCVRGRLGRDR